MAHPAVKFIHRARPHPCPIRQHFLLGQRLGQQFMFIRHGGLRVAAAHFGDGHTPTNLPAFGRRKQLGYGNFQAHSQLFQRVIGRRHLPVFDLGQGGSRKPRLPCGLLQRPVARFAQRAHTHPQIQRFCRFGLPVLAGDLDQRFGVFACHARSIRRARVPCNVAGAALASTDVVCRPKPPHFPAACVVQHGAIRFGQGAHATRQNRAQRVA